MCTAFTVIGTILLAKFAMRSFRFHRYGACGHFHGPPWGLRARLHRRRWGRHAGPIDLGDPSDLGDFDFGFGAQRAPRPQVDVQRRVDEILKGLELNARQAAEAGDALSLVRGAVGPERFARAPEMILALRAASRPAFDADLAAAALGPALHPSAAREAIDALEHLHNILTEEQRSALDRLTARS